ncbi:RIM15 [Sanghuangporus weigelae]
MSDGTLPRRQPPSPLVFSPETVLPPISIQGNSVSQGSGSASGSGAGPNTVSMPFIKRHVTRRLKSAKQECDKDLQRVTNAITAFFEERLREGDVDQSDVEHPRESVIVPRNVSEQRSAPTDEASSDGGYDAEGEGGRHHRLRVSPEDSEALRLTRWASSPGVISVSPSSSSTTLQRQNTLPKDRIGSHNNISTAAISATSEATSPRKAPVNFNHQASLSSQAGSRASRRLSRTIHIPVRPSRSGQSSRSTSRSRSPLPGSSYHGHAVSSSPNRRSSRILVDDPVDPIMTTLYEIIGVCTDIQEMSISQLTAQPKLCSQLVQRVQQIGKAWDEHPDWHGRNWYVQVLLAVASLSRVVEWWEAEKQFWNFDDDDDDEEQEPFSFLLKPAEAAPTPAPTPTLTQGVESDSQKQLLFGAEIDDRLRLSQSTSQPGQQRDGIRRLSATGPKDNDLARPPAKPMDTTESARVLATERLRLQAEQAQNQNIVIELSLDGDHLLWINRAWAVVIGSDPEETAGTKLSRLLAAGDDNVFRAATEQLLADDSHTIEVRFRMKIEGEQDMPDRGTLYREMEGKGMLMIDQVDGQPSHTMWVIKPVGPPMYEEEHAIFAEAGPIREEAATSDEYDESTEDRETSFGLSRPLSSAVILCRICENSIPEWFFEKHNETCNDFHRLEADIAECNESITELRNTIRELRLAIDRSTSNTPPEYRGMPILLSTTPPNGSGALHLFRPPLVTRMQRMGLKRMQRRLLEQLDDVLQVAYEVSLPSLKEEEAKEPIERQRLLSPTSDRKMTQIRNWSKPTTDDVALTRLINDVERLMRSKMDNVVRMQNTIKYAEKIRQEWEEKMEQLTLQEQEEEYDEEEEEERETGEQEAVTEDDRASITAEYAFSGETVASSEPTPVALSPEPTPVASSPASSSTSSRSSSVRIPAPSPAPMYQSPNIFSLTRSSTPASITSPLALVAPIVASSDTDNSSSSPEEKPTTLAHRKSQVLEPRVTVTPPISPSIAPRDSVSSMDGGRHSRRLSAVNTSSVSSPGGSIGPLSPRIPSVMPSSKSAHTSIKDFEIIKPISKGAFGSVFLAKKRVTGDYYAIKVLRKADMIAKNQITNVKAERMILMNQAESPFVAKLYFAFQSKENLYLVMEYLNGGDCAALIKSLGSLPEEWTRQYIAEVVLGLEYLHERGIVHRDLKPDNLLIDQHGHLKLTDFGLSRIGLLGRQTRDLNLERARPRTRHSPSSRPPSMDAAYLSSPLLLSADILGGSYFSQRLGTPAAPPLASSPHLSIGTPTDDVSESSGSDSLSGFFLRRTGRTNNGRESPIQSFASELTNDLRSYALTPPGLGTPPGEQKFAGTPDYLAPESILGISGDDAAVDWWALGVITYEFLYGIPPFHAETPEKVFENILSGHIDWHEGFIDFSLEALDFMKRLLNVDPSQRLGANGAAEVKAHPFFAVIDWDKVTTSEAAFIPQVTDPESTDYFDPRGASTQLFHDDDGAITIGQSAATPGVGALAASAPSTSTIIAAANESVHSPTQDEFGTFAFKNLPVLKQANDDVIRKLKTDQMTPMVHALSEPAQIYRPHRRSVSQRIKKPPGVVTQLEGGKPSTTNPPSPATSVSSVASSPSRASMAPSTPGSVQINHNHNHSRKPSEFGAVERFKHNLLEGDVSRRNSMPSRLRTASVSTSGEGSLSDHWPTSVSHVSSHFDSTPPSSNSGSLDLRRNIDVNDRAVICLLAEDNPITAKIIETLLIRLGCRVVVTSDGSEAISVAHSDIKFDCILMDLHMPIIDGESAARLIKSTNNKNSSVPIISVSAYSGSDSFASTLFAASISKPVQKADLLAVMRQLGFKTSTHQDGGAVSTRVITAR